MDRWMQGGGLGEFLRLAGSVAEAITSAWQWAKLLQNLGETRTRTCLREVTFWIKGQDEI